MQVFPVDPAQVGVSPPNKRLERTPKRDQWRNERFARRRSNATRYTDSREGDPKRDKTVNPGRRLDQYASRGRGETLLRNTTAKYFTVSLIGPVLIWSVVGEFARYRCFTGITGGCSGRRNVYPIIDRRNAVGGRRLPAPLGRHTSYPSGLIWQYVRHIPDIYQYCIRKGKISVPVTLSYDIQTDDNNDRTYLRSMLERFGWRRLGGSVFRFSEENEDWLNKVIPSLMFFRSYVLKRGITLKFFTLDAASVSFLDQSDAAQLFGTTPADGSNLPLTTPTNQQSAEKALRDFVDDAIKATP